MARKRNKGSNVESRRTPKLSYRVIDPTGVIPVARPSSNIQLIPIVQPASFVPYSTQAQSQYTEEEIYE